MTPEALRAIEDRCSKASAGPWDDDKLNDHVLQKLVRDGPGIGAFIRIEDKEFCKHARTDLPALVQEVKRLTEERDQWREVADGLANVVFYYVGKRGTKALLAYNTLKEGNR